MEFDGAYEPMAMIERAVHNARPNECGESYRWVAVMDTFATGSTMAVEICKHFGLDPNELVSGATCITCNP